MGCLVDLSAAFRLKDAGLYPTWYGFEHDQPGLLADAVYGLPELYRADLKGARLVATPGCYVTAASLALAPLVQQGLIDPQGVVVDAASGVTGAGRALKHSSLFATVDEDFTAYGLLDHRHTPEIEQVTGAQVLFTPHLAPMSRGILATCYARPAASVTTECLLAALAASMKASRSSPYAPSSPSTKATLGSNAAHLTARFDPRTGYVVVLCAIDNLTKGASGGALQAANVALGLARDLRPHLRRAGAMSARTLAGPAEKAAVLVEALPYIRRFWDRVVVVKYGGNALAGGTEAEALELFAQDVVLMRSVGMRPVVVHGGGPQISELMQRLGKVPEFRNGLRVTDAETVDIARMVLRGQVNPRLVAAINVHGALAVGVSGEDAGLISATPAGPGLGFVGHVGAVNPTILHAPPQRGPHPGRGHHRHRRHRAGLQHQRRHRRRRASPTALAAEKLVYLTDIEGLRRDVDDPSSLIRQTTAAELEAHGGRRHAHRRHDPQDRVAASPPSGAVSAEPTSWTAECPTSCCSSSSPTPASARWSPSGRRRHDLATPFATDGLDACPYWPVFGPPQVMFVRGRGTELWDDRRPPLPRLPLRPGRHVARPRPSGGGRGRRRARPRTLLHVSNFFANPVATETADRRSTNCWAAAARSSSATRAPRPTRPRSSSPGSSVAGAATSWSARSAASTAAPWPRWPPPASRPSTSRSSPCQKASATSPSAISTRWPGRVDPSVTAVLIEAVQGEGGVIPRLPATSKGSGALCDERGAADDRRRGPDRPGPHRPLVRLRARRRPARRGLPGQGPRQRHAHRRLLGPPGRRRRSCSPATTARTFSGTPIATAAARAVLAEMRRIDAPALARSAGDRLTPCPGGDARRASVRGLGLLLAAELDGRDSKVVAAACLDRGLVVNNVTPTALRLAPPLTVSDEEIDEAVAILKEVLGMTAARHFLDVTDLTPDELRRRARPWPTRPAADLGRPLEGAGAALIFEKPSNRTRQSMEMAVFQLGGHPVYTRGEEVGFDSREPVEDVTRIMAGYHAVLDGPGLPPRGRRAHGGRLAGARWSTCSPTGPTRSRRWPTS